MRFSSSEPEGVAEVGVFTENSPGLDAGVFPAVREIRAEENQLDVSIREG